MSRVFCNAYNDGGMLAFFLPKEVGEKVYATIEQLPDSYSIIRQRDLHITLLYFTKEFLSRYGVDRIYKSVARSCDSPVKVKVNGVKQFSRDAGGEVFYLAVDEGDAVVAIRQQIINAMADDGIEYIDSYEEYIPHVTVAYGEKGAALPDITVDIEFELNSMAIAMGQERTFIFLDNDSKMFDDKAGKRINYGKLEAISNLQSLLEKVQEELMGILKWAKYEEETKATIPTVDFVPISEIIRQARLRSRGTTRAPSLRSLGITPNWSARVGEVIIGNLARGEGGKFISADNINKMVQILSDNNISPAMMQAITDLLNGKQVQDKAVVAALQEAGLMSMVDGQQVLSGFGNDLVRAIKTGDPDKVKELFEEPKAGTSRGGGGGGEEAGEEEEVSAPDAEILEKLVATGRVTEADLNALVTFGKGEAVDNTILEKLLETGLIRKDADGNFRFTTPGNRFYNALLDKNLRAALDAMSEGRELYYASLLEEGEEGVTEEDIENLRITDTINTIGALHDTLSKPIMESLMNWVLSDKDLGDSAGVLAKAGIIESDNGEYKLTPDGKALSDAIKAGDILKALDILGYFGNKSYSGVKMFDGEDETWLLTWTTNSFEDRDGEIFTLKAIEDYVERHKDEDIKGEYLYWHVPGLKFGDIKAQLVAGNYLVELGTFDKTPTGEFFKQLFTKFPNGESEIAPYGWGNSHGYKYLAEDRADGVYEWFDKKETSVLPLQEASNPYTLTEFIGVKSMSAFESIKRLGEKLGMPELADKIVSVGKKRSKQLEDSGIAHKAMKKTEDGVEYPAGDYAYVPDPEQPSTWKLRLSPPGKPGKRTREQLGAAAAAFSPGGFRGKRVQIPQEDVAKVKAKIRSEYNKLGVDMPESIKALSADLRELASSTEDEVKTQLNAAADEFMKVEKFNGEMAEALAALAEEVGGDVGEKLMSIVASLNSEPPAEEEPVEEEVVEMEASETEEEKGETNMEDLVKAVSEGVAKTLDLDGLNQVLTAQKEKLESDTRQISGIAEALKQVADALTEINTRLDTVEQDVKTFAKADEEKVAEKMLRVPQWGHFQASKAAETVLSGDEAKAYRKPTTEPAAIRNITKVIMGGK